MLHSPARRLGGDYRGTGGTGGPPFWRTRYWSASMWIIVVTSAVSMIDFFLLGGLSRFGALGLAGIERLFLWQVFTYPLLHGSPIHLIFNMLWLYLLSPLVEPMLGKQRFVALYIISGLTGGAAFLIVQALGIGGVSPQANLVGASGSILGIMACATCIAPRYPIRFWFPPITIELWVLFLFMVLMSLLALRMAEGNAGGDAAHLGGAAAGMLGFKFRHRLNVTFPGIGGPRKSKFWKPGDPASKFFRDV
jgi:membrane associated rhomboid family serine protease